MGVHPVHARTFPRHRFVGFQLAIEDVAERLPTSLRHPGNVSLNALDEGHGGQFLVFAELKHLLVGIERIPMIRFVLKVGENPVIDFPVGQEVEQGVTDVVEERFDCIHILAVSENHHFMCWVSANCQRGTWGDFGRNLCVLYH